MSVGADFVRRGAVDEELGFREEGEGDFLGVLYIEVEGARSVQMRCGFRPRNRDRTL